MRRLFLALGIACAAARPAAAHPAPFSYIDAAIGGRSIDVAVVAHVFDLAHEARIEPSDRLLDPAVAAASGRDLIELVRRRFQMTADGRAVSCEPSSAPEIVADRQSLKFRFACVAPVAIGSVAVRAEMFPYDPIHQTFLNIYDGDALAAQAILDRRHASFVYFAGTRQGTAAVVRKFLPAGVHHILIGPDHLLFLVGLLLLGGSIRQLAFVVTAFTLAHSLTLSLAALDVVHPPARVVEPAIALSIVYVGADNLLVRGGRDVRAWIACAFGFVHGFGFASVLREMDLPARALGWSLFSFNLGVEIGQLLVVVVVASLFAALRARSAIAGRRLVVAGSLVVIAAGAFWFVQRVFFL